jgi:hypothetical protein
LKEAANMTTPTATVTMVQWGCLALFMKG